MANKRRDNFSEGVKRVLAERVAYLCSNPDCGHLTVGPSSNEKEKINIGVAAHICAASPGGPRYDTEMTPKERSDITNGIWLCQSCSKLIDSDVKKYTVETLKAWKKNAEEEAIVRLNHGVIDLLSDKEMSGWIGYSNWSNRSVDESPYIIKDSSVIYKDSFDYMNKKNLLEGINLMRNELAKERSSIRLAGLSGTGKTRLAQALFDDTIGENALDKSIVIYGDVGDMLKPDPIEYIQKLVKSKKRIILIVDNCEANMHNKLTKLCQVKGSNISLMTIEYDVKEDDNVDSNNFYLGPTTPEILREMLKIDYDYIDDRNIDTIVRCSDGNYRIAIYLAKAINKDDNIGILKDNNLLDRLFYQGGTIDEKLMKVGKVCSLFYSFNNNYEECDLNELNIISKIADIPASEIINNIEILRKRQIVQRRGDMRAILPHALANRLASDYLNHYPIEKKLNLINSNNRLLISFFRRLKNIHNNEKALTIANDYLMNLEDNDLVNANDCLIEILKCINILHPTKLLYRVNRISDSKFFTRDNPHFYDWVLMLSYTAYDKEYFQASIENIIKFALSEEPRVNNNSIHRILYNFFHIYLSNTRAPLSDRLDIIDDLINSEKLDEQELGLSLLEEVLEYGRTFYGSPLCDFGTKIRDYGLMPKPIEWFNEVLNYIDKLLDKGILYDEIKEVVANSFVDLYRAGFGEKLDQLVQKNLKKANWPRIWVALLTLKRMDKGKIPNKYMKMINNLIELVKPSSTSEKLVTYLYGGRRVRLGLDVAYDNFEEVNKTVYELGKEIGSNNLELRDNMLLINNDYDLFRVNYLAKGIYDSINDKENLIYLLLSIINDNNDRAIKIILNSFVSLYHNSDLNSCNKFLDKILLDEKYNKYFMSIQLSYDLDEISLERLKKAIKQGLIDDTVIYRVETLIKNLKSNQVICLLEQIKTKTKNGNVIIDSLYGLSQLDSFNQELKKYARSIISELDFEEYNKNGHRMNTYSLSELIKKSFEDDTGANEAKIVFNNIRNILNKESTSFYDLRDILEPLINKYPQLFLDIFINYNGEPNYIIENFFKGFSGLNENVINLIPCNEVINWIKKTKKDLDLSYILEPYRMSESGDYIWNELAEYLFQNYSDIQVVKNIIENIYPISWDKDFSEVMKERKNMLVYLRKSSDKNIRMIGKEELINYQVRLQWWLERESKEHEDGFGRFE